MDVAPRLAVDAAVAAANLIDASRPSVLVEPSLADASLLSVLAEPSLADVKYYSVFI